MKEKRNCKVFSAVSYIIATGFLFMYFYCEVASYSSFLRAGMLVGVCFFTYCGTYLTVRDSGRKIARKRMKIIFSIMFILYLILLVTFLFFDGNFGRNPVRFNVDWSREYLQNSVILVPFQTSGSLLYGAYKGWISTSVPMINIAGNFVAFMPFALFLPVLFKSLGKAAPFLFSVTITVITVELLQLCFMCGVCDIDDLILNVGGAGFLFAVLHIKPVKRLMQKLTFDLY